MVTAKNATDQPHGPDRFEHIALRLAERGWCVTPDFLFPGLVDELRDEAGRIWEAGGFHPAGVGRGAAHRVRSEVRTDRVSWLDPHAGSTAQRRCLQALETLRQALNRELFLGLFDFDGHFAIYPPGGHYRKHLDQFHDSGRRAVSCIIYLNRDWTEADGGELRLYTEPNAPSHCETILPLGGQLVTFLSHRFPHEVLPARRERISLTGWFRRRAGGRGERRPDRAKGI